MATQEADVHRLAAPLSDADVLPLRSGDRVRLSGCVYAARDAAHRLMAEALARGEPLPFDPEGQVIYYVGPSPAAPGRVIGAAGPTTAGRMDAYAPALYRAGVRATIGKGARSEEVRRAIRECRALYLAAVGGAGALLAERIVEAEVIAYPELGPEAVRRLRVEDFPAVVAGDAHGGDLYAEALRGSAGETPAEEA
jgi:fumarate hydratase subunit beta